MITPKLYIRDQFNDSVIIFSDDQDFDDVHLFLPNIKNYDNRNGRRKSNIVVNSIDNTFTGKIIIPSGNIKIKDGNDQVDINRADILKLFGSSANSISSGKVPLYGSVGELYCDRLKFRNRNNFINFITSSQSSNQTLIMPNLGRADSILMFTSLHQTI